MKTRLIIASIFTFIVALCLAVAMRTPVVAQDESAVTEPADPPAVEANEPPIRAELLPVAAEGAPVPEGTPVSAAESPAGSAAPVIASEGAEIAPADESAEVDAESEGTATSESEGTEGVSAGDEAQPDDGAPEELTFDFTVLETDEEVAVLGEDAETLSVDFPDEEIRSVLRIVADLFDLNLVVPETLVGRASIKLRNVTWQQVFDVVLSPVGFTYVEEGNIIKVVSLEALTLEPPVTVVTILDYAQAEGILPTIQPLVNTATGGRIQIDTRSNALVITERPTQLRRIENIIASLDKPNVQVMIESKFIETRNNAMQNIGVDWASLENYAVTAGDLEHSYERNRTRTRRSARESGSSDNWTTTNGGGTTTTTRIGEQNQSALNSLTNLNETAKVTTAVFSADDFGVILSALRRSDDVKLVSNPTIVTMNNKEAHIHIGEKREKFLPQFHPETGQILPGELVEKETGIKLDVTPQVNRAGFINLNVRPEVSSIAASREGIGGMPLDITAIRTVETFVTVKDGYTLAIGGLIQDDTLNAESRVPVLGSIPVLGRLFRHDSKNHDQRNLIIFLTARSLSPDGSTIEETVDPRMIHNMGIQREEIPGYRPDIEMWPKTPEELAAEQAAAAEAATAELLLEEAQLEAEAPEADVEIQIDPVNEGESVDAETVTESEAQIELIRNALEEVEDPAVETASEASEPAEVSGEAPVAAEEAEAAVEAPEVEVQQEPAPVEPEAKPETSPRRSRGWLTP